MAVATEILLAVRMMVRLYDKLLKPVSEIYHLNPIEANIISFLHNNPDLDTASDIVELRRLPKGNVSQGVESLIGKGLLRRERDKTDRRRVHLYLTREALPVVASIEACIGRFSKTLFAGFSAEEAQQYTALTNRMLANVKTGLEEP